MSCKKMKSVIEKILTVRKMTEKFASGEFHLRIENNPFMPLVIERHGRNISVSHYIEQDGDLIPDPDMEFLIGCDGEWYPVGIQHCRGSYRRVRWNENGKEFIDPREQRDQISFSGIWARNIKEQGFITAGLNLPTKSL